MLACGILETYTKIYQYLYLQVANLYSLDKKLCARRPEGDLIGLETESWKTQRKTTSWHPQESEENWVPTQAETG